MAQSTGLVQITNTWVESDGNAPTQVVGAGLALCMSMTLDPSLLGNDYSFDINWQVVEVATGKINNNWAGQIFNNGNANNLDSWFTGGGGDYTWQIDNNAIAYGVNEGGGYYAESRGQGMYILRVYIFVDASADDVRPPGGAQWAVSNDLYFWCD